MAQQNCFNGNTCFKKNQTNEKETITTIKSTFSPLKNLQQVTDYSVLFGEK